MNGLHRLLPVALALVGLANPAPSQIHVHARLGKHLRIGVDLGEHGGRSRWRRFDHGRRHHRHGARCWRTVVERVRLPGRYEAVFVPARYEWRRDACGRLVRVLVEPAHHERRWVPGHWTHRQRRVLICR